MEPIGALLMTERKRDIERDIQAIHPEQLALPLRRTRPAWRRHGGAAARRLSVALADIATELDPAVCRPSYGRE